MLILAGTAFDGTAQVVVTGLIDATSDPPSLTWCLIAANLTTAITLLALSPRRMRAPNEGLHHEVERDPGRD